AAVHDGQLARTRLKGNRLEHVEVLEAFVSASPTVDSETLPSRRNAQRRFRITVANSIGVSPSARRPPGPCSVIPTRPAVTPVMPSSGRTNLLRSGPRPTTATGTATTAATTATATTAAVATSPGLRKFSR